MPAAPKKKKCRNCEGSGWVYADSDEPCYHCVYHGFDPDKQKNCTYCSGKGYVVRKQGFLCCHCENGYVYEE
jgi:DnaJ-class molecular chaperone